MKIIDQIKDKEYFTKAECNIIEYLMQNKEQIAVSTISDIAKKTYTSNATIIRLSQKLGFQGFRDFKVTLLTELEMNRYMTSSVDYSMPFGEQESSKEIIESIYTLYHDGIRDIHSSVEMDKIEKATTYLTSAKRIVMFAKGDTQITVKSFMNKLIKINCFPILATENGEEDAVLSHMLSEDVAMFITYSANNPEYIRYMRILKQKKVPIIILTANEKSHMAKMADICMVMPDKENQQKVSTFYSQFGFLYYLSLLYSLMYKVYQNENRTDSVN